METHTFARQACVYEAGDQEQHVCLVKSTFLGLPAYACNRFVGAMSWNSAQVPRSLLERVERLGRGMGERGGLAWGDDAAEQQLSESEAQLFLAPDLSEDIFVLIVRSTCSRLVRIVD